MGTRFRTARRGHVTQARRDHGRWGEPEADNNPGLQPLGVAGGLSDPATGLVHFGARDYDPGLGRWVEKDPIGFAGGDTNLYGYVLGDPVNLVDPSGNNPGVGAAPAACASNACCVAFVTSSLALVYSRVACYASGECKTPPFPDLDFDWPDMCKPIGDRLRDVVSRARARARPRTPSPPELADCDEEWKDAEKSCNEGGEVPHGRHGRCNRRAVGVRDLVSKRCGGT